MRKWQGYKIEYSQLPDLQRRRVKHRIARKHDTHMKDSSLCHMAQVQKGPGDARAIGFHPRGGTGPLGKK